jgi:hypothetical protein
MVSNVSSLFRSLFIYSVCLPLAVLLGYLMANPYDIATFGVVGAVLFLLVFPLLLKWHHTWLIVCWNMTAVLFFLPGRPQIWLAVAWCSFLIAVGQYILNRNLKFLPTGGVGWSLAALALIVVVTAKCTGGFGVRALGGDTYGGKRYILLLTAILGFFALTSQRIPLKRGTLFVGLFFLGAFTQLIGDLGSVISPSFYFIFWMFPLSSLQGITGDVSVAGPETITRLGGLSLASSAGFCVMLSRYGIRDIFNLQRPARLLLFMSFVVLSLLGGYRSVLVLFILTFAILFYTEGLMRSRLLPIFVLGIILGGAALLPFVDRLPLSVQRTLSVLPVKVDPVATASARDSTEWRLMMWKNMLPQVPDHLILGKGYSIDANDYNILGTTRHNSTTATFGAELAGDYHNGPLSVILPFGLLGAVAFTWFLIAGIRLLYNNYRFADPAYASINRFLLCYFVAKVIFFCAIFGSLHSDLLAFAGLLGLSICLNGGVAKPVLAAAQPHPVFHRFKFHPSAPKAVGYS